MFTLLHFYLCIIAIMMDINLDVYYVIKVSLNLRYFKIF